MIRRHLWALWIAVAGAGAIGLGFYLQAQSNARNAAYGFAGMASEQTFAPWAAGGIGVVLLLIALVLVATAPPGPERERVEKGWHDDPQDSAKLRYHNGRQWTLRTAEKDSPSA